MIVEDEAIIAMDLESLLRQAGYGVAGCADSGASALGLAHKARPDLAIVDIRLRGEMDGIELARRLRADLNLPVVFGTAHGDETTLARASQTQPFGYMLKPFSEEAIRVAIEVARARFAAEERIKQLERWLAATLKSIADGVIVASLDGTVSLMNPSASTLTGWSVEQALGRPLASVFALSVDGQDRAEQMLSAMLDGAVVAPALGDATLRTKAGTLLPIDHTIAPTHDESGRVSGVVVVFRDRTRALLQEERSRMLDAKLYEAQRFESIGVLAGGIAHDFNNLLGVVLGNASLLQARMAGQPEVDRCLRSIEQAARSGAELCAQILAYAGIGPMARETVDLSLLVESALPLLRSSLAKDVELRIECTPQLPKLLADAGSLRQVVMNLVINASEAIGHGHGTVSVRTSLAERRESDVEGEAPVLRRYVSLEVTDDGEGMPPEVCRRVFDPFFSTKFQGRGLGLAAVRGIVDSHGGHLTVESRLGGGSTFCVQLPAIAEAAGSASSVGAESVSPSTPGRALLVDDEAAIRAIGRGMLEALGFVVDEASDGDAAVRRIIDGPQRYRFVLMDLTMPRRSGIEAAIAMHKLVPELPILLMSGYTESALRSLSDEDERVRCLSKPFSLDELRAKLEELLAPSPRAP